MSPLFPLLFSSSLTVMAGAIITPAMPLIAEHFKNDGHSEWQVGLVLTMPALLIAIVSPFIGNFLDKFGRRKLFFLGLALYSLGGTAGLYVSALSTLLLSRALLGVAVALVMTSVSTMISDLYHGEERLSVMGKQAAAMAYGGVAFLLFGGLFASYSWRMPFAVYFTSIFILAMSIKGVPETLRSFSKNKKTNKKLSLWHFKIGGVIFTGMIFFYLLPTTFPFLMSHKFSIGPNVVGPTIACGSLVGGLVSFNYRKILYALGHQNTTRLIFSTLGLSYIMMGVASYYWICILGALIGGVGAGLMLPHYNSLMAKYTNEDNRGKSFGLLTSCLFLGQFSSPLISMPIKSFFSYEQTFIIFGVSSILCGIKFSFIKWPEEI